MKRVLGCVVPTSRRVATRRRLAPVRRGRRASGDATAPKLIVPPSAIIALPGIPKARLIAYSGNNTPRITPIRLPKEENQKPSRGRLVYGYYSYAGQMLDDDLATYWILPAAC